MKRLFLMLLALCLVTPKLFAWTNGELLIWMDNDRGRALTPIIEKFKTDLGLKVTIETPEKITDSFPIAAQAGKGPDIVIWAHDKVGEWAGGGLIAPIEVTAAYKQQFYPMAWDAVRHRMQLWGYPISLEAIGLIYNKKLVSGAPPTQLSELVSFDQRLKSQCPGTNS